MATILIFVALGILPRTTTLVALTYPNKYSIRRNRKLQQNHVGGDKKVSQRMKCLQRETIAPTYTFRGDTVFQQNLVWWHQIVIATSTCL